MAAFLEEPTFESECPLLMWIRHHRAPASSGTPAIALDYVPASRRF
jgi:hypothetical protein